MGRRSLAVSGDSAGAGNITIQLITISPKCRARYPHVRCCILSTPEVSSSAKMKEKVMEHRSKDATKNAITQSNSLPPAARADAMRELAVARLPGILPVGSMILVDTQTALCWAV